MPPGGGNGSPPGMPGIGGPLPFGEADGGKGGNGGMPRPPGAEMGYSQWVCSLLFAFLRKEMATYGV